MKFSKRFRILALVLGGGIVVASSACSVDSLDRATAPTSLSPSAASLSRGPGSGATSGGSQNGTFTITIDPRTSNTLSFGPSKVVIPANAICAIGTSSYGPDFWNSPCDPETGRVQLQITVTTTSLGTSLDFSPNLRFSPASNVQITLAAPQVQRQDAKDWVILYCSASATTTGTNGSGGSGSGNGTKCVNEALTDKDLSTFVDYDFQQLTRRIKHFSAYSVSYGGYIMGE